MNTYKEMQRNYLGIKDVAVQKEQAAKEAKEAASKSHSAFLRYCRKQLKSCEKAGLVYSYLTSKSHYRICGTNITLCVNREDDGILIYNYDRPDYFSCPLENVKFAFNIKENYIWPSLTEEEQEKINKIMEHIL